MKGVLIWKMPLADHLKGASGRSPREFHWKARNDICKNMLPNELLQCNSVVILVDDHTFWIIKNKITDRSGWLPISALADFITDLEGVME